MPPSLRDNVVQDDARDPGHYYITYAYRTAHPVLRWLPTKLAEWIGSNLGNELGIPKKQGSLWTASELNAIITGNIVGGDHGHLHTFGCIQWECELFNGRPKARCYPFDIQGHHFRKRTPRYTFYEYKIIYDIVSDIIPDICYHMNRIYVHQFCYVHI